MLGFILIKPEFKMSEKLTRYYCDSRGSFASINRDSDVSTH